MAPKKITSKNADFDVPVISGHAKSKQIRIKINNPNKYDVYQKDLPTDLPDHIDWINSFGVKAKKEDPRNKGKFIDTVDSDPFPPSVEDYVIELDDVEGKEPVYWADGQVQSFPKGKKSVQGKAQVTLGLGDPPIGWPK